MPKCAAMLLALCCTIQNPTVAQEPWPPPSRPDTFQVSVPRKAPYTFKKFFFKHFLSLVFLTRMANGISFGKKPEMQWHSHSLTVKIPVTWKKELSESLTSLPAGCIWYPWYPLNHSASHPINELVELPCPWLILAPAMVATSRAPQHQTPRRCCGGPKKIRWKMVTDFVGLKLRLHGFVTDQIFL